MKSYLLILLYFIGFSPIFAQEHDPFIEDLIYQTNIDSLISFVRILSGEDSVILGETTVIIEHQ